MVNCSLQAELHFLTRAAENTAEGVSDHWSLKVLCTTMKTTCFLWEERSSLPAKQLTQNAIRREKRNPKLKQKLYCYEA